VRRIRHVLPLLLLAALLRSATQSWDSGLLTPHPDERQVAFVAERTTGWFSDPGFYAYGSLHFSLLRTVTELTGQRPIYEHLLVTGRALSLLASLLTVGVVWWLGRRAFGRRAALLAAALLTLTPLDLQLSHYATVEAHHAFWVAVALALAWLLARRPEPWWAAAAGVAIGASLAVKVASLPLLAPLAVALIAAGRRRGAVHAAGLGALAAATTVTAFWLGQPWAFAGGRAPLGFLLAAAVLAGALLVAARLRREVPLAWGLGAAAVALAALAAAALASRGALNPDYLKGVGEQMAMVTGAADMPYTRVYRHTLPVLYPLRELLLWGLGPAFAVTALAAGAGALRRLARRPRRLVGGAWGPSTTLLLVLLAWLIPTALRFATLQVKFLRYWEPLLAAAALLAGWFLATLPERWRRPAATATIGATALAALAYLWAFAAPHPYVTARAWLDDLMAPETKVAFEHWDEDLRLPASASRVDLTPYDLPDNEAKIRRLCDALARADYVVLTTHRVRRTLFANPDRFPLSARLYKLLLAGEAGFLPLTRFERAPRLFGLELPVQLADESFVNYEFPRVVVLRRAGALPTEELLARVARALPGLEAAGFAAFERRWVGALPRAPAPDRALRQLVDGVAFVAALALLGAATWVLLLPLLGRTRDGGAALALASGWVGLAWLLWLGSRAGAWRTSPATASALLLLLVAAAGALAWRRRAAVCETITRRGGGIRLVLAVWLAVFALFLVVRLGNPAIGWGEKPMDFTFLNAFLRAPSWPPGEPWLAGLPLHYYYFGEVLGALPIQLAGASGAVGYNLVAAAVPAFSAALLAAFGLAIAPGRPLGGIVLPALALLLGNLAWPVKLLDAAREATLFDLWWATSRVIPGFAIDEYPLWTAVFADLHAHFFAAPVALLAAAWGWLVVRAGRGWPVAVVACGVATGVLAATNPWDVLTLTALLLAAALLGARRFPRALGRLVLAAGVSVLAVLPFLGELARWTRAGTGGSLLSLVRADWAPAWAILVHFGLFLLPLLVWAGATLGRSWRFVGPVAVAGALAGLAFGSHAAALALAGAVVLAAAALRAREFQQRLAGGVAVTGLVLVALCERFTLVDRMNTLFKVYNGVWYALAVAVVLLLASHRRPIRRLVGATLLPLAAIAAVNLPLAIWQGWAYPRVASPRPTLDGRAYLGRLDPQSWRVIRALEAVARPGDVVAEAAGPSYAEFTRVAMHTGVPTVVGWEFHLIQRGQSPAEIRARRDDLERLYRPSGGQEARKVLERLSVRWVVVTDLERRTYGMPAGEPLAAVPGLVRVVDRDGAQLYRVLGATGPMATPVTPPSPEVEVLDRLAVPGAVTVRSLTLRRVGAVLALSDGAIVVTDAGGRLSERIAPPPCPVMGAAESSRGLLALCADGRLLRHDEERWAPAGQAPAAAGLTARPDLHVWGPGGLYRRHENNDWLRLVTGPVVAAAVSADGLAWFDGTRLVISDRRGAERTLAPPANGISHLALRSGDLWAVDGRGRLLRSGGGLLPWREALAPQTRAAAVAGDGARLFMILDDGLLATWRSEACDSPWELPTGERPGALREPRGIAVAPAGWFVVADTRNYRVQWFDRDGVCLDRWGERGGGVGQFEDPAGVAVAADGTLAVADTWNGRIQVLGPDDAATIAADGLYGPRGVFWWHDGRLFIADTGNQRVLQWRRGMDEAVTLTEFTAKPVGLARTGDLLAVALPAAGHIALLDPASGATRTTLEVPSWHGGREVEAYLAALPDGRLLASSPEAGKLWLVDPKGQPAPLEFRHGLHGASGVGVLPDGTVVVALTWEHRLARFPLAGAPAANQPTPPRARRQHAGRQDDPSPR
jgi:YYY domain-containing protein